MSRDRYAPATCNRVHHRWRKKVTEPEQLAVLPSPQQRVAAIPPHMVDATQQTKESRYQITQVVTPLVAAREYARKDKR